MESLRMPDYRYIRTKSNIFEVVGETEKVFKVISVSRDPSKVYSKSKIQTDALKRSNSIENLCDERILTRYFDETKYTHHEVLSKNQWDIMGKSVAARLKNGLTDCNYYGAIWTDKGLIYVAKMNNKGEFELI